LVRSPRKPTEGISFRALPSSVASTDGGAVRDRHRRRAYRFLYLGDSPNDEPMFALFPYSAGVATIEHHLGQMTVEPQWITRGPCGAGSVQVGDALLRP
jgi:hypothetical protein